jgi:hypothetical protein
VAASPLTTVPATVAAPGAVGEETDSLQDIERKRLIRETTLTDRIRGIRWLGMKSSVVNKASEDS